MHFWNPPACRRVLWIVLVSIACVGFNLRFVSPRGFFDSLTPPPALSTSKVIGLRHVDRWIRIDNHWTETCRSLDQNRQPLIRIRSISL